LESSHYSGPSIVPFPQIAQELIPELTQNELGSNVQEAEQPSKSNVLLSSQSSPISIVPSPHVCKFHQLVDNRQIELFEPAH